jgi:DNA-binding response OmpR family regulator
MMHILSDAGYEVLRAESGEDLIWQFQHEIPCLLILDLDSPELAPFEVCRRVKADDSGRSIPVLYLVDSDQAKEKPTDTLAKPDGYIDASISSGELLERIAIWLRLQNAERAHRSGSGCMGVFERLALARRQREAALFYRPDSKYHGAHAGR